MPVAENNQITKFYFPVLLLENGNPNLNRVSLMLKIGAFSNLSMPSTYISAPTLSMYFRLIRGSPQA